MYHLSNKNYHFDYKTFLSSKESLLIINCNNIDIVINSKINKLIVERSKNINIIMKDAIIGIELNNSEKVKIKCDKIKNFEVFKSNVKLKTSFYNDINIMNEKSKIKKI